MFMIGKKLLILVSCIILSVMLTGCGNAGDAVSEMASKAGDVMSDMGRDESEMMSRVESFFEGDDDRVDSAASTPKNDDASEFDDGGNLNSGSPFLEDEPSVPDDASSDLS